MSGPSSKSVIVVGVDGSGSDAAAVTWAARAAAQAGMQLRLLHATEYVGEYPVDAGGTDQAALLDVLSRESGEDDFAGRAAEQVRSEHPDLDVDVVRVVGSGAGALLDQQDEAHLIVVGTGRKGPLAQVLLGSTALTVSAHSTCPVAIINPEHDPSVEQDGPVVLASDGSRDSAAAAVVALEQASLRGVPVRCVTAWYLEVVDGYVVTEPDSSAWQQVEQRRRERAEATLAAAREQFPDVEVSIEVVHGPTIAAIGEATEGAQLLVLGARGVGGFRGKLLGSVSQKLLRTTNVPILITRASAS